MTPPKPQYNRPVYCFSTFFTLSWLHMLLLSWPLFEMGSGRMSVTLATLFHLAAWPFYSLLYLLPAVLLTMLVRRVLPSLHIAHGIAAMLGTTLTLLLLRVDILIYDLYTFHINSFVLNLVFTPGGIESLGAGPGGTVSVLLLALRITALQLALLLAAMFFTRHRGCWKPQYGRIIAALSGLFILQGSVYGISDVANYGPVLDGSRVYPLFQHVRFRTLAEYLGFERNADDGLFADVGADALAYPREPVEFSRPSRLPNIVVLVAESLRWDQLTPGTMPNTWALTTQGQHFTQHYSSGNGTREGLFGLFYGLYGSYWSSFMHAAREPLLMQRIRELDYELDIRTSAAFTYPEFDQTLFAGLSEPQLQVADEALSAWERDAFNTQALQQFLQNRPGQRPFFSFYFLESTHAPYSFPEEAALVPDYQRDVDYTELSRESLARDIKPLFNRYRNAAHWVDEQVGRIHTTLQQQGLLENTIVIITGDHGEEFMEQGAWGHNSTFVEEQVRVPLVVLWPGRAAGRHDRLTSHLDLGTTLLRELGAPQDGSSYTLGRHLLDDAARDHVVVSDWHSVGLVTPQLKYRIPYLMTAGINQWEPTDRHDAALADAQAAVMVQDNRSLLLQAMAACSLFSAQRGSALADAR